METIDPQQAARVWQRVRGGSPETDIRELLELIAHEWEDSAIYLQLSRRCTGRESNILYTLFQQEHAQCMCLKGLYTMITGENPKLGTVQVGREPLEDSLRKCYGREMQTLHLYEKKAEDPEYGYIYCHIRDQERDHCRILLELIGGLRKGK